MRTFLIRILTLSLAMWTCMLCHGQALIDPEKVEKIIFTGGKAMAVVGSEPLELKTNVVFLGYINVGTNGMYVVNEGKDRKFQEGQVINREGWLINTDGTIMPVRDHVVIRAGRLWVFKDGTGVPASENIKLGNGVVLAPDATMPTQQAGIRKKIFDGQMFLLDGTSLPAKDTILLKGGTVYVQKDGSLLPIISPRYMLMSDGTKVFGDGYIIRFNGTKEPLVEGNILFLDGMKSTY